MCFSYSHSKEIFHLNSPLKFSLLGIDPFLFLLMLPESFTVDHWQRLMETDVKETCAATTPRKKASCPLPIQQLMR